MEFHNLFVIAKAGLCDAQFLLLSFAFCAGYKQPTDLLDLGTLLTVYECVSQGFYCPLIPPWEGWPQCCLWPRLPSQFFKIVFSVVKTLQWLYHPFLMFGHTAAEIQWLSLQNYHIAGGGWNCITSTPGSHPELSVSHTYQAKGIHCLCRRTKLCKRKQRLQTWTTGLVLPGMEHQSGQKYSENNSKGY